MPQSVQQTIELLQQVNPNLDLTKAEQFAKAWTQSGTATTGITYYDLEAPSKKLFPVLTPLRNRIPRVNGNGGIQANWKAITGINTTTVMSGVGEGNRGGVITTSTSDKNAVYRSLGLEDNVTYEAEFAGQGFEDVKALAVQNLLSSLMIQEERMILGGNGSDGLAMGGSATPTPSLVASTTGGTLGTLTLSVICVALSYDGFVNGTVAGGVQGSVSRTNADASTDTYGGGTSKKSANATVAVTGATGSVAATVAAVAGAVGYAWFWATAGSEVLGAITSINSVSITATATGTQTAASLASSDQSQNTLGFSGLLYQIYASGSNAYSAVQATGTAGTGTPLTSDSNGGIIEIDLALKSFWDNYRLSPTDIYVGSQEMQNIAKKILSSSSNAAQRFVLSTNSQGVLAGGVMVRSYLNKYSMNGAVEIPIHLHPNMPAGTILFYTDKLPYPLSNVSNVVQVKTRRDYYQIEWPIRSRKYEYGVYASEVLQNYFPPAFGVISNIGNG